MNRLRRFFFAFAFALAGALPAAAQTNSDPPNLPQTALVTPGAKVTFSATADGVPAPTFEWFRGTAKVGEGPLLVIPSISVSDAGSYTAKATNEIGSAVSPPIVVTVGITPGIPVIKITSTKPQTVTVIVPSGAKVITAPSK